MSDKLKALLKVASGVEDVDDSIVVEARRQTRLSGIAYAKSKSSNENSKPYKDALEEYGKAVSAYVKSEIRQRLGHTDYQTENRHGLRYLFRRPQRLDAQGNLMGNYDPNFNSAKLSEKLQTLLKIAAGIDDDDDDERVIEARRFFRLEALAYAKSKSPDVNSKAYQDALEEHGAKAGSYIRHEARKINKKNRSLTDNNESLIYRKGSHFRVAPNQVIDSKGDLVSKHDVSAFSIELSSDIKAMLTVAAKIDNENDPKVIVAQKAVLEKSKAYAEAESKTSNESDGNYKKKQEAYIKTCVNFVNLQAQLRGLVGQEFRMRRYKVFSRFKLPELLASTQKALPESESLNAFNSKSQNDIAVEKKKPLSKEFFSARSLPIKPTKIIKFKISPEKFAALNLDESILSTSPDEPNSSSSIRHQGSREVSPFNDLDLKIVKEISAQKNVGFLKSTFLKNLVQQIEASGSITPEYMEAFQELLKDPEMDKISILLLSEKEAKLHALTDEAPSNKRRKLNH